LLQARVPGLSASVSSGVPGTGFRLLTRGIKSAALNTTPVIYVDGVRVDAADNISLGTGGTTTSSLSDLLTGSVDRIEITKGGAGSTLYGTESANGIIQIFTKKGTVAPAVWKASVVTGVDMPELQFTNEQYTKDAYYRNGYLQQYTLGTQGGNEMLTYSVSAKIEQNEGIVQQDKLRGKAYNLSTGLRAIVSKESSIDFTTSYTHSNWGRVFLNNAGPGLLTALDMEAGFDLNKPGGASLNRDSLLAVYMTVEEPEVTDRFLSSLSYFYEPFENFTNQIVFGVDYRTNRDRQYAPIEAAGIVGVAGGYINRYDRTASIFSMSYTGSYQLPGADALNHTITLGAQGYRSEHTTINANGEKFAISTGGNLQQTATQTVTETNTQIFTGGVFLAYKAAVLDRYFFDAGVRVDGNTTFGDKISSQVFPKIGFGYMLSAEEFYPDALRSFMNSFKLRGSWGVTGNYPNAFVRDRTYTVASYLNDAAISFGNPGNADLKPEKTSSVEVGADIALNDDNISLAVNYFNQTTTDALFFVPEDPASGLINQQRNTGEITNSGIEVSVNASIINDEDFGLSVRAAFATLQNNVVHLGGQPSFAIGGFSFAQLRVEKDQPVGVFRVNVPTADSDGVFRGKVTPNVLRGNPTPTATGFFGFDVRIMKNLTITALAEYAGGHNILNQAASRRLVNAIANKQTDPTTKKVTYPVYPDALDIVPKDSNNNNLYSRDQVSANFLEDATWLKLREITVRYKLPSLLGGANIWASVRNLLTITDASVDPELSFIRPAGNLEPGGISGVSISAPKEFRLGIDCSF
jgi:outer membrane receptor for ferrienterochelin and colicin